jgi:hypothetical protein
MKETLLFYSYVGFDSSIQTFVNVGPGTLAETFTFERNAWAAVGRYREPLLPVPEINGIYLSDVSINRESLKDAEFEIYNDRVKAIGAKSYKRVR